MSLNTCSGLRMYIAGPMRGYPKNNFPAFFAAEERWKNNPMVAIVINPARLDQEEGFDSECLANPSKELLKIFMERDLKELLTCDCIYMLSGWETSLGARVEHALATYLDMSIHYES